VKTGIQGFRIASVDKEAALAFSPRNLSRVDNVVTAAIGSNQGNVDICRSIDLSDFGAEPIQTNLEAGSGVVIEKEPDCTRKIVNELLGAAFTRRGETSLVRKIGQISSLGAV
jgi:hypothetical protein